MQNITENFINFINYDNAMYLPVGSLTDGHALES